MIVESYIRPIDILLLSLGRLFSFCQAGDRLWLKSDKFIGIIYNGISKWGEKMQETMEKLDAMISKYSEQLAICEIKITASKRYFEQRVEERSGSVGVSTIFNGIDRVRYRKKEKEYNYQNNRYHCIVLTVSPTKKGIVPRGFFRDYAFVLKKIERAHIGMAPEKTAYDEQKILNKIEKRILKIVSKAQKNNAEKVCKDTLWDACRYTLPQYGYKQRFLNKDRGHWEFIFLILSVVLALSVALVIYLIGKLT